MCLNRKYTVSRSAATAVRPIGSRSGIKSISFPRRVQESQVSSQELNTHTHTNTRFLGVSSWSFLPASTRRMGAVPWRTAPSHTAPGGEMLHVQRGLITLNLSFHFSVFAHVNTFLRSTMITQITLCVIPFRKRMNLENVEHHHQNNMKENQKSAHHKNVK